MSQQRMPCIEVQCTDALSFPTDVLVLKHADALYGLDAAVVRRLGSRLRIQDLPRRGDHRFVKTEGQIAAREALFIGTGPLWSLEYPEIQTFGERALSALADDRPLTKHVAMTIHGPGYGLDEVEAFQSQLQGVVAALKNGNFPECLERITFVELHEPRAARLQRTLNEAGLVQSLRVQDDARRPSRGSRVSLKGASATKEHAFIAMPFAAKFEDLWELGILDTVRASGLACERIDQDHFTGEILKRMLRKIKTSRLVIAVLTDKNPNVFLEVGYAWGCKKPTIFLADDAAALPFDVRGHRCLVYSRVGEVKRKLANELAALLGEATA